jgi:hypothetical protein
VVWVRHRTLGVVVIYFELSALPVLDVVAVTFFALHDPMDGTRGGGGVLTIVVEATSKF